MQKPTEQPAIDFVALYTKEFRLAKIAQAKNIELLMLEEKKVREIQRIAREAVEQQVKK